MRHDSWRVNSQFNLSVESNQNVESKGKSAEFRNKKNVESKISQSRGVMMTIDG